MTREELNKQISAWHDNDEYQNIIDAVDALPESEKDALILGRQAAAYNNIGQYKKAEEILLSKKSGGEGEGLWHYRLAYSLLYQERYDEALGHIKKAMAISPEDSDCVEIYCIILAGKKEYQEIVTYCLSLPPQHQTPDVFYCLYRAYVNFGRLDKAEETMRGVLASGKLEGSQEKPLYFFWLARACYLQKKYAEAAAAIDEAIALDPDDEDFWDILFSCYACLGEYQAAISRISTLPNSLKGYTVYTVLSRMALVHLQLDEFQKAEEILISIKEEGKEDALWYYRMGYCYAESGRQKEAVPYLEEAVLLNPDNEDSRRLLNKCKKESSPEWRSPSVAEHMEEIENHMDECFPNRETTVFHEILSELIHLDVFVMKPSPEENFYVLYTVGMSALPMSVSGVDEEDLPALRYGELMLFLPPDWNIKALDNKEVSENDYWPVRLLKDLARFPHENGTWLGAGHSVSHTSENEPYAPNTKLCAAVLVHINETLSEIRLKNGMLVNMYMMVPIYKEELDEKIKKGIGSIMDKIAGLADNPWILDSKRKNVSL